LTKYVKIREVCVRLHIDDATVRQLAAEGLVEICRPAVNDDEVLSEDDAERMRVISVLMHEMDVNLAGVEVILHMREELISMRRQFDEVLETLVEELRKHVGGS